MTSITPQYFSPDMSPAVLPVCERQQWEIAINTLGEQLEQNGAVSSKALRPILEKNGVVDARQMITRLKLFNFDEPGEGVSIPDFRFGHRGRSFLSEDEFRKAEAETERAAEAAEQAANAETENEQEQVPRRKNRQEEARLVKYVEEALENIYASDYGPDVQVAFDVHNERPGSELENIDALAINWRSDDVVEIVSVEVKLDFCAKLVQQANNYRRFSHRVWIALPVSTDEPGIEIRESAPSLFEYVIEQGIGILACRRRQGHSYEIWPIQWPRLNQLDSLERIEFMERYRTVFEETCVVESREESWRPMLR